MGSFLFLLLPFSLFAQFVQNGSPIDTLKYTPSSIPTFQLRDRNGDPFSNYTTQSPLYLKNPNSISLDVEPELNGNINVNEKIGSQYFRPPSYLTFDEFSDIQSKALLKSYWKSKSAVIDGESAVNSRSIIPKIRLSPMLDRIFGGSFIEIIPRGNVTLDFGAQWQKIQNPSIPIRLQRNGGFIFNQQIRLAVTGKIGEKLKITANFDNNNSFDNQNIFKFDYTGLKEDILKKIEIGNVGLPLSNSLISGAQNLFGVKAQFQFGKLFVTALASTQRGKEQTATISTGTSGANQGSKFEIPASSYDENRHFFLSQFFRDHYEGWLKTLPQLTSGLNITRIEVYVINRQNDTKTLRDVVGLMDLGENKDVYRKSLLEIYQPLDGPTDNRNNNLYSKLLNLANKNSDAINQEIENLFGTSSLVNGVDFEKLTSARKLATTEFSYQKDLGYITLTRKLQNDEALAVSYEYTYNGKKYKVGELSEDYSNRKENEVIFLKLLRPRKIATRDNSGTILPTWTLMMKNIYALNVGQLQKDGFQLRVIYKDDRTGIDNPQIQDGNYSRTVQLIQALGLDRLNPYGDPQPDGNFDYVERLTINSETGLIIFPYLEPFGAALRDLFSKETDATIQQALIDKYAYDTLYNTTRAAAELVPGKNKFFIVGTFRSGTGKEFVIPGFNISKGSVKAFAGGSQLVEGVDFIVDSSGKMTILNEGILNSGKEIQISYEQPDSFTFQTRTLMGSRFDYHLNKDVNIGATLLYYRERPTISRNLIGTEPAKNLQYGIDFNIKKDSRLLTKLVDGLPFLQTKEVSTVSVNAEYAQLLPGTTNVINGDGTSFIDDFENSAITRSLMNPRLWNFATTPKDNQFNPANGQSGLSSGFRRAKIAWYRIDNLFYRTGGNFKPGNITQKDLQNHYVRLVSPQEIFPYRDLSVGAFNEEIFDLAYYPSERGPYNYNPDLNVDGSLKNPVNNWAGITTAFGSQSEVDFDKSNVEYIEFWMMDPFINNQNGLIDDGIHTPQSNTTGGKLIFHLGSISEDFIPDGRHAFENGLPIDGNLTTGVQENDWGYVTTQQFLNNAFNTIPEARKNQDVGLDGIGDEKEKQKFADFIDQVPQNARAAIEADPSADNFRYFLNSDFDTKDSKILSRYKNINGIENDSPIISGNDPFAPTGSNLPENEDLNADNTLNELEEYYSYNIDLKPGAISVGNKFIVDKITPSGIPDVTWYLVRIPIRQFDEKIGAINGFKSIKYARMILTGFSQPIVLRLANFRTVANNWRTYRDNLAENGLNEQQEPESDNFYVSTVNIEENGFGNNSKPSYVPPLARDRNVSSPVYQRLNEQSIQLCVTNLKDGDARAIYKIVNYDLFNYGRIKMFLSAHGSGVKDNEMVAFLRLGTDFDQNFYEIQVPLKITPDGNNPNIEVVWPIDNQIDLDLNELYSLKVARDREGYPLNQFYPLEGPKKVGKHGVRVFGRPDLSQLKALLIGVRNPTSPDNRPLSVCLWADELRLTNFDRTAGWATNVALNTKLADLGNISTSIRHISFGYGGAQSKISERARGSTTTFDISGNFNIDKLLPRNTGLVIPMFASYQSIRIDPNFDPANPDLRIVAIKNSFKTDAERKSYEDLIQDRAIKKSINFTNVKKNKVKRDAPSRIYDIENFSFSYSFSEGTHTNFNLIEDTQRNQKGSVAWQYRFKFKGVEPFSKAKWKSKWLLWLKEFNFNPLPSNISVRGELERSFRKIQYRNSITSLNSTQSNITKFFVFNRFYNFQWNLTKSLSIDYSSIVNAIIDEPDVDPMGGFSQSKQRYISANEYKDSVNQNLKNFGRMKNFQQTINANYTLPLDKFPITDWLGADYQYNVVYNWKAAPQETNANLKLGNIIQNQNQQGINGRIDLVKLYNKVKFLKEINSPPPPKSPIPKSKKDTLDKKTTSPALSGMLRFLMAIRSINGSYTITQGTVFPGFTKSPSLFGLDNSWTAPGIGFVLGSQDKSILQKAGENGWVTKSTNLTTPFVQNRSTYLSLRAAVELTKNFKIQLDMKKSGTTAFQEIFRWDDNRVDSQGNPIGPGYVDLSPNLSGSYRVSTLTIGTSFMNNTSLNSDAFAQFVKNIAIIKERFSYIGEGYESKSQDVLIPAFISAYSSKSASKVSLSPFPSTPLPNWSIEYNGLNEIPFIKKNFQSVRITNAYSSLYSVANFSNSLEYSNVSGVGSIDSYNKTTYANVLNQQKQLIPVFIIDQVVISEQFSPLIGISITTKNKFTANIQYKTKRDLSLNISNAQVTELNTKDLTIEVGYLKNNLKLPFKSQGKVITLKNDLNFRLNISVSNNRTIQRKIDDASNVTSGNINTQIRPNISYTLNKQVMLQLYFERSINNPLISSSFRRATTQFGFKLTYNLAQ